jgi:predicted ATPase
MARVSLGNTPGYIALQVAPTLFRGGTGVGKSSLLNALLDEASVLPTSGSQGCTAAPIELRFNSALQQTTDGLSGLHVYTARVEFISQDDWDKELPRLVADI